MRFTAVPWSSWGNGAVFTTPARKKGIVDRAGKTELLPCRVNGFRAIRRRLTHGRVRYNSQPLNLETAGPSIGYCAFTAGATFRVSAGARRLTVSVPMFIAPARIAERLHDGLAALCRMGDVGVANPGRAEDRGNHESRAGLCAGRDGESWGFTVSGPDEMPRAVGNLAIQQVHALVERPELQAKGAHNLRQACPGVERDMTISGTGVPPVQTLLVDIGAGAWGQTELLFN